MTPDEEAAALERIAQLRAAIDALRRGVVADRVAADAELAVGNPIGALETLASRAELMAALDEQVRDLPAHVQQPPHGFLRPANRSERRKKRRR